MLKQKIKIMGVYNTKTEIGKYGDARTSTRTETFPDGSIRKITFYPGRIESGGNAFADTVLVSPQYGDIYSPLRDTNKTNNGYAYGGQTISPELWKKVNEEMDKLRESMLFPAFNRK